MNHKSGGELVVEALINCGVDTVFGLPGIQLDPLFDALYEHSDRITTFVPRHEQTTTYMADGYSRATGKIGVAIVVPGPGLLNALTGLATAHTSGSKILLLTAQIPTNKIGKKHGALHEILDQTGVAKGVSEWVKQAKKVQDLPELIAEAIRFIEGAPANQAILELPQDILQQTILDSVLPVQDEGSISLESNSLKYSLSEAELLMSELLKYRKISIFAGRGVITSGTEKYVQGIASILKSPVVMSENARGILPKNNKYAFNQSSLKYVDQHVDAHLILGSRARNSTDSELVSLTKPVLRIDIDENRLQSDFKDSTNFKANLITLLPILYDLLNSDKNQFSGYGISDTALESCHSITNSLLENVAPQMELLKVIQEHAKDGSLVFDFTQLGYVAALSIFVNSPKQFIWPGFQGTLGYSFPTSIGVAIGSPHKVICVTGDGGFSWGLSDLSTAVKYSLNLIVIVMNDGYFGNVRRIQKEKFNERYIGTELANPDYSLLADAFGLHYGKASCAQELDGALKEAMAIEGPVLIEFIASEFPSPWNLF